MKFLIATILALAAASGAGRAGAIPAFPSAVDREADRQAILEHIHAIFQAYLDRDRDALRRLHTADWTGFQGPSTKIERNIDDYMVNAESSLQHLHGTGYKLLDTEIQFYGDIALVYYIARYDYVDNAGKKGFVPLRSIDIYRREGGKWNQCGSHITPMRSGGNWGEGGEERN